MSFTHAQPPVIPHLNGPVVFLGGPIQGAPEWQAEAVRLLLPSVHVANPRLTYKPGEFDYAGQVDWESALLRRAAREGVVLFWLAGQVVETPGRSYAQTSRYELAEWVTHAQYRPVKLAVGISPGFGNARYIRRRTAQDLEGLPIFETLEETCAHALSLLPARA